jgi:hypothetical protein
VSCNFNRHNAVEFSIANQSFALCQLCL